MMLWQNKLEHLALERLFIPENAFSTLLNSHILNYSKSLAMCQEGSLRKKKNQKLKPKKIKMSKSFVDIDNDAAKAARAFSSGKTF